MAVACVPTPCASSFTAPAQHFASLIVDEIRQTLHSPTEEAIEQELIDLELLALVRESL